MQLHYRLTEGEADVPGRYDEMLLGFNHMKVSPGNTVECKKSLLNQCKSIFFGAFCLEFHKFCLAPCEYFICESRGHLKNFNENLKKNENFLLNLWFSRRRSRYQEYQLLY